jgi:hypothetical protein
VQDRRQRRARGGSERTAAGQVSSFYQSIANLNTKRYPTYKRVGFLVLVPAPAPDCVPLAADRSKGKIMHFQQTNPKETALKKKFGTFSKLHVSLNEQKRCNFFDQCVWDSLKILYWHNSKINKKKECC